MAEQVEKLKQQLSSAITARQSMEKVYEEHFGKLSQFISRLTYVCRGIDIELDNRLAKLRKELKAKADISKLTPLLDEITQLLKHQENRTAQNIKATQTSLNHAGKVLQKQRGLPDNLRRQLRALLESLNASEISTVHSLVPLLEQLTQLYQEAFKAKHNIEGMDQDELAAHQQEASDSFDEIASQLLNLVSELAFEGDLGREIESIRSNLLKCKSSDQLVDSCLSVIRLIVSSISEERSSAQYFLVSLNDALSQVHQAVLNSLSKSKHINEEMVALNEKIQSQIKNLSMQSEKATSLDELQKLVSTNLKVITDSIIQKEELEREEKMILLDSLSVMEERLVDVEKTANTYKKHLAEQKFKSLQDSLTRLPNRAAFDERMEIEFKRWQRYNHSLCMAVVDIDHFKKINDTFGHSAGDKTLKVIAQALKKTLRGTDFIARYGGEEFVILIPESSVADLLVPLNKIRESIKRIPFKFKESKVQITISIGATMFTKGDGPREAFDRADSALYKAKNNGRDQVIIA